MKYTLLLLSLMALAACNSDPLRVQKTAEGIAYYNAKQYDLAIPALTEAAKAGNTDAQLHLAKCYDFGYGVPQNVATAVMWYTKAANAGNANAQNNLAYFYSKGIGVQQNKAMAFRLYSQAAAQNEPSALNSLGLCYNNNNSGVTKNPEKAAYYFRRAADLGFAKAQYNLGRCYYHGIGVPMDMEKSREWISKAAAQGNQEAAAFMEDEQWQQDPT